LKVSRYKQAEIKDSRHELRRFRFRLAVSGAVIAIAFLILLVRFINLQVIQHAHYQTLAESNRIAIVPITPNRGLIMDRNGTILASNYPAYTLEIEPKKINGTLEILIDNLSSVVKITPENRRHFKELLKKEGNNSSSFPIRTHLGDDEVARFAAHRYRFPGVEINARLFRRYPVTSAISHVIGHMGRITDSDMKNLKLNNMTANYRGTDHIGKTGIEQQYEHELHGTAGYEQIEMDANGRVVRILARVPPVSGNNLVLALDLKLQQIASKALGNRRGAFVAIDPNNGNILALVSNPGFDLNLFADSIDIQSWNTLNTSPDKPLLNRALQGLYPPGSTFKPFMAFASLELNKRAADFTISDPGFYTVPGSSRQFRDWKADGHGDVDMHRAIVVSCDTYFYGLANELGIDDINKFSAKFGFGRKTGIDISGEASGILPSQQWKKKRFGEKWYAGETAAVGIGQGYIAVTPLQLAHATSIIANNGTIYTPRLINRIIDSKTEASHVISLAPTRTMPLKPENIKIVRDAMVDVTQPGGTAAFAGAGAKYVFAGKTGTSQVIGIKQDQEYEEENIAERFRDHALFIAFAPAYKPTIALAVVVENGGHGSTTAAPIARQVLDYYLLGKNPSVRSHKNKHESND